VIIATPRHGYHRATVTSFLPVSEFSYLPVHLHKFSSGTSIVTPLGFIHPMLLQCSSPSRHGVFNINQ
jgi:hypothetical protein